MNKLEWVDKPEIVGDKIKFIEELITYLKIDIGKQLEEVYHIDIWVFPRLIEFSRILVGSRKNKENKYIMQARAAIPCPLSTQWIRKQNIINCSELIQIDFHDSIWSVKRQKIEEGEEIALITTNINNKNFWVTFRIKSRTLSFYLNKRRLLTVLG